MTGEKMMDDRRERGSASLFIELKDSKITVKHGTTNEIMFTTKAVDGDWKKLWSTIQELKL